MVHVRIFTFFSLLFLFPGASNLESVETLFDEVARAIASKVKQGYAPFRFAHTIRCKFISGTTDVDVGACLSRIVPHGQRGGASEFSWLLDGFHR